MSFHTRGRDAVAARLIGAASVLGPTRRSLPRTLVAELGEDTFARLAAEGAAMALADAARSARAQISAARQELGPS